MKQPQKLYLAGKLTLLSALALVGLCSSTLKAQCPTGSVLITSDAEAMAYETNFGSCTELPEDLILDGAITYSQAFVNLEVVFGNMTLNGTAFTDLDDFANLLSVDGTLSITNTDLTGEIANVTLSLNSVGDLVLDNNDLLEGTGPLSNFTFAENVTITGNALLTDIAGLENTNITDDLTIQNNAVLSNCAVSGVCASIAANSATILISGNNTDCNSSGEIKAVCFPDLAPLLAFYAATDGPNWTDNDGWQEAATLSQNCDPCSSWEGVTCENGRVTELDLGNNGLSGPLPAELFQLSELKELDLDVNSLTGALSGDIRFLTNLELLSLRGNSLSGSIPADLGLLSNLENLQLANNNFNGTLSPALGNLTSLRFFQIQQNNLTGNFPVAVSEISTLVTFIIFGNDFSGPLPRTLSTTLTQYNAAGNEFTGQIPNDLYVSTNLLILSLNSNNLDGPLPEFSIYPTITFALDFNNLSGCYPTSYSALCGRNPRFVGNVGLPDAGSAVFFDNDFCVDMDACGSLPVTWSSFTATAAEKAVRLAWTTSAEENNEGFIVERSRNGDRWTSISDLLPSDGNGVYDFVDEQPLADISFYRVRQLDYDGAASWSAVARVELAAGTQAAYPNPFRNEITLYASTPETIEVIDQHGRLVLSVKHAGGGAQVQRMVLESGVYFLRHRSSGRVERIVAR